MDAPTERTIAPSAQSLAAEEPDRANILIVDDRPDKLLVYRTLLEELDQNLFKASSGD